MEHFQSAIHSIQILERKADSQATGANSSFGTFLPRIFRFIQFWLPELSTEWFESPNSRRFFVFGSKQLNTVT